MKPEDIALIVREMEVTDQVAKRQLRLAKGDAVAALVALTHAD